MEGEYYHTEESVKEYITLAKEVDGKQLIEKLIKVLSPNSNVLELGSGPGSDWEILDKTFNVIGSDLSIEFLKHLRSKYPSDEFLELDAVNLTTQKKFNGIYSNKVLHHLSDKELVNSLQHQSEMLESNGIICHSFWKGVGSEVFKGMFVNYHEKEELEQFFSKNFKVLTIELYAEFDDSDSIVVLGQKK